MLCRHTLARTTTGRVYSWGRGTEGQLGLGNGDSVMTPTPIKVLDHVRL